MRFLAGFLIVLALISPVLSQEAESQHAEEFEIEKQDLENLKADRIKAEDAVSSIKLLVFLILSIPSFLLLLKFYFGSSDVDKGPKNPKLQRAKNRGQGADIDPYRGIGNDPL